MFTSKADAEAELKRQHEACGDEQWRRDKVVLIELLPVKED